MLIHDSDTTLVCEFNELVPEQSDPQSLLSTLVELRDDIAQEGLAIFARWRGAIQRRAFPISSLNLSCYLVLRRRDLRPLQMALLPWGLCSLGRSEALCWPTSMWLSLPCMPSAVPIAR